MYHIRTFKILAKRLCRPTSVVDKGDRILLTKEGCFYKTLMREKGGFEYWVREFLSYEKAVEDFCERVESRVLAETICLIKI